LSERSARRAAVIARQSIRGPVPVTKTTSTFAICSGEGENSTIRQRKRASHKHGIEIPSRQNGASIRLPLAHRVLPRHIIRGCSESHGALPNFWKASLFSARLSVLLPSHRSSPSAASRSGRRPRAKCATLPALTPLALLRDCDDLFFAVLCASQRFASPSFGKPLFQVIQFSGLGQERGARFGGI